MSNRELRLRYLIELASNVAPKARQDAQAVEEANSRMERAVGRTERGVAQLDNRLSSLARNSSLERQVTFMDRLASSIDRVNQRAQQLKLSLANGLEKLPEISAGVVGGYYGAKPFIAGPVREYATLESAVTDLKSSLMNSKGEIDASFEGIIKKAKELGSALPGSTSDFVGAATTLKAYGMSGRSIAGGGLEAASYFAVLTGMSPAEAARTIAKAQEVRGLSEGELPVMADIMQRTKTAFGIEPRNFEAADKYLGGYRRMGWTGVGNAWALAAMQGHAGQNSIEGEQYGTGMRMILQRLPEIDELETRKAVAPILKNAGIDLNFYRDGKPVGVEGFLSEMAKLRALDQKQRGRVVGELFGTESAQLAESMIDLGPDGLKKKIDLIKSQASQDQRLELVKDKLINVMDSVSGSFSNLLASMGNQSSNGVVKPGLKAVNDLMGRAGDWIDANPTAGTALMGVGATAGALAMGLGGRMLMRRLAGGLRSAPKAAPLVFPTIEGAAPAAASRLGMMRGLKGSGLLSLAALGLESYDVITNDDLTAAGKARGLGVAAAGAGGAWAGAAAGAKLGATLGTFVAPGVGTAVGGVAGGLIGGGLGYWAGSSAMGAMWAQDPKRDFVRLTDPRGMQIGGVTAAGTTTVQLGEGTLAVRVSVDDQRTSVSTSVQSPLPLVKIDAGATNPGSFSGGMSGAW